MRVPFRAFLSLVVLCIIAWLFLPSCGYDACADIPVLTSISPTSVTAGGPGFTLTLTGRHFHSDTVFFWGTTEWTSTTVDSATITVNIDAAKIATPGTVQVFVSGIPGGTNLNGPCGGGPSDKLTFTIQ